MTPQEEALNGQVCNLDVIKDLQAKDDEIIEDLEGLKDGQEDINSRLDKGAVRMDGIEDELKKLSDTVKDGLNNVITEIRDHKITELTTELKIKKAEGSTLKTGLILIAVTTVVSIIGYLAVKAFG